jgi:hypothetical protein
MCLQLTPSSFYSVAALFQLGLQHVSLVPLNFNGLIFYRTAHTTFLFQGFRQRFQLCAGYGEAIYNGDCLAATPFSLAPQPNNAVTCSGGPVFAADALMDSPKALGAPFA